MAKLQHMLPLAAGLFALAPYPHAARAEQPAAAAPACGPPPVQARHPRILPTAVAPNGKTRIHADHSSGTAQRFVLRGNVELIRGDQRLWADRMIYNQLKNRVDAKGNVRFRQPGLRISGDSGYTQIRGQQGEFNGTHYELPDRNARGDAAVIHKLSDTLNRLDRATYTTCPPQRKDWELKAREVKLDRAEGVGTARNVTVEFKGVPFFYAPWLSFPISDRRKSGFLLPRFGSSNNTGADFSIPYYWNIAPNRDATITPRILAKRGLQLNGEYRYLTRNSRGTLGIEYLPHDKEYGNNRWLFAYRHHGRLSEHWSTDVDINSVSDQRYFQDLSQSLSLSSTTNLERRVDLRYANGPWSVLGRLQNFQAIGTTAESYQRLPQLLAQADIPAWNRNLTYHLYGEAVRFYRKENVTTGTRIDLNPGVSLNLSGAAWYATPKVSLRYTRYSLSNPGIGKPDKPSRTTPILSLDSGLFLERDSTWAGRNFQQTLEPRLFYLYVPYRDQSQLPVFDSGALDFSFAQLFRENRFTGADRQGDANQLTLALTSRYLEQATGRERLRASLGEVVYFRNREVTLPGGSVDTTNRSALVGELSISPWQHSSVTAELQWDPHAHRTDKSALRYHFQRDKRHIVNLAYRFRRNDIQQTDVSALWPISQRWNGIARWNYSLRDSRTLETLAGLEYDSCCWDVRLVARRYVDDAGGSNTAIYAQLVLKGLTSIGKGVGDLLERGILGYGHSN